MASETTPESSGDSPSLPPADSTLPAVLGPLVPPHCSLFTDHWSLITAFLFGLAYTQAPLYYSNQNQYFLHGLAQGGMGLLADDWLANTTDPTPVFSGLVALTYRFLGEVFFYLYYLVILGIYAASLLGLFAVLHPGKPLAVRLAFAALLVLVHSGLLRLLSGRLFDVDYPWYFQAGVAGQYLLGPVLQPSTFGVLLLLSIFLFIADRPVAAAGTAAFAALWHFTYLLSAGIIVFSYLCVLLHERRRKDALLTGTVAILLVAPVFGYNLVYFTPASATTFAEASVILADFRIPHHCHVQRWFDVVAGLQILWVLLAIYLVRGTRLYPVMAICSLCAVALSVVQVVTWSPGLALLFPWRPSTFLVPIATAVVLGRLVVAASGSLERLAGRSRVAVYGAMFAALIGLAGSGLVITQYRLAYQMSSDESAMMAHVQASTVPGDVYLLPVDLPKPRARPGASMSDFKPLDQRKRGRGLIPIELQGFRLRTGAPIFVDFKSIPYRDVEVIEWHRRIQGNLAIYEPTSGANELKAVRARHTITHVVVPADHPLILPDAEVAYHDEHYRIYRLAK